VIRICLVEGSGCLEGPGGDRGCRGGDRVLRGSLVVDVLQG
jgi:hypothetical protein